MGIKCSNTAEVYFDNTPVPAENMICDIGDGFKVAMEVLNNGRFGMAAALSGTQKQLIHRACDFAANRKQFTDKIMEYGAIQEKIARLSANHFATESIAYLVSQAMDAKATNYHLEAAIGKIFGSEKAWECADETIQTMGGMGFMYEQGVEKVMRDLRIFRIFEGSNEILRLMIALQSMQVLGKILKENKGMAVKAKVSETLGMSLSGNASGNLASKTDSSLSSQAKAVEDAITKFHICSVNLLVKHQKKIMGRQFELKRVADCMIDLYACGAVLSRATAAVQQGKENADVEVELAKIYVDEAVGRLNENIRQIQSGEDHFARMGRIGKRVAESNGVMHTHPLGF